MAKIKKIEISEEGTLGSKRKARRNISGNYEAHFTDFDIDQQTLRSELDPTFGLIRINTNHTDYVRVRDDENKFSRYTTYLLAQEIAHGEFIKLCEINHQDPAANLDLMRKLTDEFYIMSLKIGKIE